MKELWECDDQCFENAFSAEVLPIPSEITNIIHRIQREFPWNSGKVKIKHETICNDFQDGGLKNVDIPSKISSLQCSRVKKLYDQNFHDWKLIPMHFINNAFGKNFIFIHILVSKLLYCIGFLLFTVTFFNHSKELSLFLLNSWLYRIPISMV